MTGEPIPKYGCGQCWPSYTAPLFVAPRHSMPVQMPVPMFGTVTIAIMDSDGGVSIKVDQPRPD